MSEVTNPSPVVGTEQNVPASTSNENAASVASLKDVVKQATGREYSTDEEALKGIKETYQAVTARHTEPQVPLSGVDDVQLLRHELKVSNWFQDHPEYKDVKDVMGKFGSDPEKVVTDPSFQKVYGALKQANESQNRTVLTSNPRLATPRPDDYAQDVAALRAQQMQLGEFLAKHKGVPMPTE